MFRSKKGMSLEIGFADDLDDFDGYSVYVYVDTDKHIDIDSIFKREILYINQCLDNEYIKLSKENPISKLIE